MNRPLSKKQKVSLDSNTSATCQVLKKCSRCGHDKPKDGFTKKQWKMKNNDTIFCRACIDGGPKTCANCNETKIRTEFSKGQYKMVEGGVCRSCFPEQVARNKAEEIRKANLPRNCTKCGTDKAKSEFSERQWKCQERKCIECLPREEEEALLQQEAEQRKKRKEQLEKERMEAQWEEDCGRVVRLKKEHGIELYGYRDDYGDEVTNTTNDSELVGTYKIIYTCTFSNDEDLARTTRGTLIVSMNDGLLKGEVKMDSSLPNIGGVFQCDLKFEQQGSGTLLITENTSQCGLGDEITGSLGMIGKQYVMKWIPNESCRLTHRDYTKEKHALIEKRAKYEDCQDSWLKRFFPQPVVDKIYSYTSFRPNPTFALEEGDVRLIVVWDDDSRDPCETHMVARRCSS